MREGVAIIAFTPRGKALGQKLAEALGASLSEGEPLRDWTQENFPRRRALIFIGAAGIAVRAVAPWVKSKTEDPAVLCLDEGGRYVIPLLSGHLGGANALARELAALTGGEAVITTATDGNAVFAVDLWAKKQGLTILQPERIKVVSAALLRGEEVGVSCPYPIAGEIPAGLRLAEDGLVEISCRARHSEALQLVPRVLTLGIGCRRGTTRERLEESFARFCRERGVLCEAIAKAASIVLKQNEQGLLDFCAAHAWPLRFYTAEALRAVEGNFHASAFVRETTGVDNVCERAALAEGGRLLEEKYVCGGVTFALGERAPRLDWSV